jgi:hypothetical protein
MQRLEEERLDSEEVAGEQLILVRPDELAPGCRLPPLRGGRHAVLPEGGAHGRGADGVAVLAQLPLDAAMPPARVLPREPEDERFHLGWDGRSTTRIHSPIGPLAPDQLAVPREDRVRLEEEQVLVEPGARAGGQPGQRRSQDGEGELLAVREPGRAGALALEQAHLVPQHEDLEVLLAVAAPRAKDQIDEERDEMPEYEPQHPALPMAPTLPTTCHKP